MKITPFSLCGIVETYDLEVEDEFYNFIADGFGMYNSQESTRYCVAYDTLLTRKNKRSGGLTVEELHNKRVNSHINQMWSKIKIMQLNESTGEFIYSKVGNVFYNGYERVYEITTRLGYVLKCTASHNVLTDSGYRLARALCKGVLVAVHGGGTTNLRGKGKAAEIVQYDKISTICLRGSEKVYDIVMSKEIPNFVANGVVVHNCNYDKDKFGNEITVIEPCFGKKRMY